METLQDVFEYFKGNWTFERHITSLKDGATKGHASGRAVFTPQENGSLNFHEEGELYMSNQSANPFFQSYLYRIDHKNLVVEWGENSPRRTAQSNVYQSYHLSAEGDELTAAPHICGEDIYNSHYHLLDENSFSLVTFIESGDTKQSGKKSTRIDTVFRRMN